MKKIFSTLQIILLILSTGSIFGCITTAPTEPYYVSAKRQKENVSYTPHIPVIPLLNKKNSFLFSANYGANDEFKNFDVQTAFMPGKKLGIKAAFTSSKYKEKEFYDLGSCEGIELGAGYVAPSKSTFHFDVYGGISSRNLHNKHYTGDSKTNFTAYYIQPSFYVSDDLNIVQFSLTPKFSLNHFNIKLKSYNSDRERLVEEQFTIMEQNPNQYFFEPTALLRIGGKSVKFQLSYTFSKNLTSGKLHSSEGIFSLGMLFTTR